MEMDKDAVRAVFYTAFTKLKLEREKKVLRKLSLVGGILQSKPVE